MSAYLVSDKSMSVCARSIEHFANRKGQFGENAIWKALDQYHNHFLTQPSFGSTDVQIAEKLFYKLVEINMLSLLERYNNADREWGTSARSYTYDPSAPVVGIPIVIDLLDNWQYQSCEGVAVETDFYKLTETIQNRLAREYVRQTRPYEDTVWGIDDYSELDRIKGAKVSPSASGDTICGGGMREVGIEQITNTSCSRGRHDRRPGFPDRIPAALPG